MDELFCDATSMIDAHISDLSKQASSSSTKAFFNLNRSRTSPEDQSNGFFYDSSSIAGVTAPDRSYREGSTDQHHRLRIASHLANHIRQRILTELGFTTSAGISHNKLLSKTIASLNKPDNQTCWYPTTFDGSAERDFIGAYELPKIVNFGYRTVKTIRHHLLGEALPPTGTWTDAPENQHPYTVAENADAELAHGHTAGEVAELERQAKDRPLTAAEVLAQTTEKQFTTWFGERLGVK